MNIVTNALKRVNGVSNIKADFSTERVTVTFEPPADFLKMKKAVEDAGYGFSEMAAKAKAQTKNQQKVQKILNEGNAMRRL